MVRLPFARSFPNRPRGKSCPHVPMSLTLMWSGLIVLRREAQPCPVSPRPCRKIIEAVCLIRGLRITGLSDIRDIVMMYLSVTGHCQSKSERKRLIPRCESTASLSRARKNLGSNPQVLMHFLMITSCSALYLMCL